MKLAHQIEARIGTAAIAAAFSMIGDAAAEDVIAVLKPGAAAGDWSPEVHFLCLAAGDAHPRLREDGPMNVPPEALYRWMEGRDRHWLPADGWLKLDTPLRNFFEYFTYTALGLARALAPEAEGPKPYVPLQNPIPRADTVFAKSPRGDERTGGSTLDPATPTSTAGVVITRNVSGAEPLPAFVATEPVQFGTAHLDAIARGERPSPEQFMAMSPEERRPWALLFGMASFADEEAAGTLLGAAPQMDGEVLSMSIDETIGGLPVQGETKVIAPRGLPQEARKQK